MRGTSAYLDRPGRLFKAGLAPVGEKRVFGVHPDGRLGCHFVISAGVKKF